MSFIARNLLKTCKQPYFLNNLNTAFRSLCITPQLLQQRTKSFASNTQIEEQTDDTKIKNRNRTVDLTPTTLADVEKSRQEVFQKVNEQLAASAEGRLFAVVQLCGKQFKVTAGDIILVEGYWPPTIGDEIRLDKVLLAGARDFTLIGRPLLQTSLVEVKATIIEKTLTHTKTHFKKKRRKQYMRINFQRSPNTMIRINTIELKQRCLDEPVKEENDLRIF